MTNLRRELHQLRRWIDDDSLEVTSSHLCWHERGRHGVDLATFLAERRIVLASDDPAVVVAHGVGRVAAYAGDLLPGMEGEWLEQLRAELRLACVQLCDVVTVAARQLERDDVAIGAVRRRIAPSPSRLPSEGTTRGRNRSRRSTTRATCSVSTRTSGRAEPTRAAGGPSWSSGRVRHHASFAHQVTVIWRCRAAMFISASHAAAAHGVSDRAWCRAARFAAPSQSARARADDVPWSGTGWVADADPTAGPAKLSAAVRAAIARLEATGAVRVKVVVFMLVSSGSSPLASGVGRKLGTRPFGSCSHTVGGAPEQVTE
jgi:hypothetical protein